MANRHQFKVVGFTGPQTIDGEPHAVYRYVERSEPNRLIELDCIITVDDYIEDPEVSDFFVVLQKIGDNKWLCYYHGKYAVCVRLTMGFKGNSFLDAGYFYAPYIPLKVAPVVDPTSFDKTKGIVTRYGKKLLAEASKVYGS